MYRRRYRRCLAELDSPGATARATQPTALRGRLPGHLCAEDRIDSIDAIARLHCRDVRNASDEARKHLSGADGLNQQARPNRLDSLPSTAQALQGFRARWLQPAGCKYGSSRKAVHLSALP